MTMRRAASRQPQRKQSAEGHSGRNLRASASTAAGAGLAKRASGRQDWPVSFVRPGAAASLVVARLSPIAAVTLPQQFGAGANWASRPSSARAQPTQRRCTCTPNRHAPRPLRLADRAAIAGAPSSRRAGGFFTHAGIPLAGVIGKRVPRPRRAIAAESRGRVKFALPRHVPATYGNTACFAVFTVMESVTEKPYSDVSATGAAAGCVLGCCPYCTRTDVSRATRGQCGRRRRCRCRGKC
jgi:hypothetical protein